ncbi:MAG TPA: sigma-70 family RNA polymerase sigma factor [Gaiellaceae bacterium]|nr:sigma-70 family RNA polymerase sigma factor [Gaiellaceae bacterium]
MEFPTTRRLTAAEAERLWRSWKTTGDQQSRDRLVLAYLPMVRYLAAKRVRELPTHRELDDLASCGMVAIIEAVDRFDPAKGATFEQYAWTRVTGAIIDELRRADPMSRSSRALVQSITRAKTVWLARNGRHATDEELAEVLHIDIRKLREALAELDRIQPVSLSRVVTSDEGHESELGDSIPAEPGEHEPELAVILAERSAQVRSAMATLSDREREVIGLVHVRHLQGEEIGRMLGVSESRISQILGTARKKLMAELASYDEPAELIAV